MPDRSSRGGRRWRWPSGPESTGASRTACVLVECSRWLAPRPCWSALTPCPYAPPFLLRNDSALSTHPQARTPSEMDRSVFAGASLATLGPGWGGQLVAASGVLGRPDDDFSPILPLDRQDLVADVHPVGVDPELAGQDRLHLGAEQPAPNAPVVQALQLGHRCLEHLAGAVARRRVVVGLAVEHLPVRAHECLVARRAEGRLPHGRAKDVLSVLAE